MKNKQEIWHLIEIETKAEAEEAVEFALNELDSLGNEIDTLGKKASENLHIIGYFKEKIDDEVVQKQLKESLRIYGFSKDAVIKYEWREVENRDWLAEWKKGWKPTETGKFIIAPTWETVENSDKIVIRIDPEMAFGTGTHETTRLCLGAIEKHFSSEMSFFDVGTGTGILAIGWEKMKSKAQSPKSKVENSVIKGCDTDEDSVEIARKNAKLNDVEIEFYVGSISEDSDMYDFVCANMTIDIIAPMLSLLLEKTKKILILSGILSEQQNLIESELRKNKVSNWEIETLGEWISVTVDFR